MYKLPTHTVGTALGVTIGILYVLCALAYVLFPGITKSLFAYMFHGINVTSLLTPITFWPTVIGLVVTLVSTYISGALFAFVWNALVPSSENK
ncbi:MAG: hypothetical protein HZB10_01055 [Candidatus Yonathbacteria bacterium]|nr:hypothetical protein [Candidatus Yonathbacteria bacterium]